MRALVWFRSDLRTADNPALHEACREADRGVVAVFLLAPGQWAEHGWGPPKADFVLRSVKALSAALRRLNIGLLVRQADRFADAPEALLAVAREHGCDALYLNEEYEVNESRRDEAVAAAFTDAGLSCRKHADQTVVPAGALRTGRGNYFTVFTPFRRAWLEHVSRAGLPALLPVPARARSAVCLPDRVPARLAGLAVGKGLAEAWPAGEAEAQRRLAEFAEREIHAYHERRDECARVSTSLLSPYLAAGVVSPRQCLHAAVEAGGDGVSGAGPGPAAWISELVWREFYRSVLVGFPRVCMGRPFQLVTERIPWRQDEAGLAAWQEGRTGVPIVDAGMRELAATGWMHNRLRMITATFLAKHLLIDWRRGERHFLASLVDADFASNNGGWQWCASTGTDAAPYFRVFNPYLQGSRHDPDGTLIRRWVPELADLPVEALHDPALFPPEQRRALGYPEPIVGHDEARARVIATFKQI